MALDTIYRELMAINSMNDDHEKLSQSQALFEKLNHMEIPAGFNWVAEIFEGMHVRERGANSLFYGLI